MAAVKRFHNEARALVMLDHPHIVRALDFAVTAGGRPFLVMERLRGRTVGQCLDAGHRFSVASAVEIALQVGDALVAAHSEGIFHRDLKPDNIFLTSVTGKATFAKVLDFGISRLPDSEGRRITGDREVLGTPDYMSPEQAQGHNHLVNGRTDQHALALVIYEMLSGVSPFAADDMEEALRRVTFEVPRLVNRWASNVPLALARALHRALAKNPLDRYPGIDEFMEAIASAARKGSATMDSIVVAAGPARSMPVAKTEASTDPVRTVVMMLARTRAAFLKGDIATARTHASAVLDTAALTDDDAIASVIELGRPLLEGVFHSSLEPMDRTIALRDPSSVVTRPLSEARASFLSSLPPSATIAEVVHATPLPRLHVLRTLVELHEEGAFELRAPIPRTRSLNRLAASDARTDRYARALRRA
jgi:hypothetical protein